MHFLLSNAVNFKKNRKQNEIKDFNYDTTRGAWLSLNGQEYLVKSENEGKPVCGTKKNDLETGEDLKSQ